MTAFDQFLEPIEVACKSLSDEHQAYCMDGRSPQPDMKRWKKTVIRHPNSQ